MTYRRETSQESAARLLALLGRVYGNQHPAATPRLTTLQQFYRDGEYLYLCLDTGREYTALEARAIKGPKNVIDFGKEEPPVDRAVRVAACPKCGAVAGVSCVLEISGRKHLGAHSVRLDVADAARSPSPGSRIEEHW